MPTDAPLLLTRAAVAPSSVNEDARTVEVTWSTGADVERRDWYTGERYVEALSMNPKHIRLGRLNAGAPVLDSHNAGSTRNVLASVVPGTAKAGHGIGSATIKFSRRPEADAVFQDVKDGVLRNVSVGYVVHNYAVQKASKGKIERRTAVDWEPFEISIVPIPADAGAQVRAQDERQAGPAGEGSANMDPNELVVAERKRVSEIETLCRMHKVNDAQRCSWIETGAELDDVREAILAEISRRQTATHISPLGQGSGREQSMVRDAADALARRAGVKVEGEGHRHFGDARMMDIAKRVLEMGGVNTGSLSGSEIAKRALSTSDFADVLGAAGMKIVRNAYEAIPLSHREVLRRTTANDFRAKHVVSNAAGSILPEVPEGGVYPHFGATAEHATYALKTYGGIIGITRQMIVNDDFGLVESAARQRGRSAAETERKAVWDFITQNSYAGPNAPDGSPMFDNTAHKNFPAASATPISADTLAAARTALRTALSPDGFATNGLLKHVIVAPGGETAFDQLLNGIYTPTSSGTAMTASLRNVQLHVEPLISATKKHWIGFTDYAQCDHFEISYLSGSEGPRLEQRVRFESDALELKCVLDFGIGAVDWRGVYCQREN